MIKKLITGIFLGATALGLAQFGGTSMPQTDYMPALFLNPAVAKDMHLSPDLVSKETSILMQQGMALMPILSKQSGKTSPAQRKQLEAEVFKAYEKMSEASLAPLSPAQRVRYRQLSLQFFGPSALILPKNEAALGLSSSQKIKLQEMLSSTSQGMASEYKKMRGGSDMSGAMGALRTMQTQTRATQESKIKGILTPAQLGKWQAMQGKKLPEVTNLPGM